MNERFWKDYIDYVLGLMQTELEQLDRDHWTATAGWPATATDFTWGTVKITATSSLTGSPKPYMHYADNPLRPRTHFWFGPLTMVDFLGNYNLWDQVTPEQLALLLVAGHLPRVADVCLQAGHSGRPDRHLEQSSQRPGVADHVQHALRSRRATAGGSIACASAWAATIRSMQESLWYPPSTIGNSSATVRPYDSNNLEVPRAMGGTCYSMALMLAYNQFSGNTSLLTYNPGRAQRATPAATAARAHRRSSSSRPTARPTPRPRATLNNLGSNNSYYSVRYNSANPGSSEFPTGVSGYSDNARP